MVLSEVEKRRSGATDVAGIDSTRRARRENHGKIFTLGVLREKNTTCQGGGRRNHSFS